MNPTLYREIKKSANSTDVVESNLKLVVHLAKKYQNLGMPLDDLISEGTIGLVRASQKYEESKGKFSTYAAMWIKATIRNAISEKGKMIRIPNHKASNSEEHIYVNELDPTYQGFSPSETEEKILQDHNIAKIALLMNRLTDKQRFVIQRKFGIGCNEMKTIEIAEEMNLSQQMVNAIIRQSLKIMKDA